MGAAASSRIRILRGWLPRQVGLLPARGGEKRIEGYARRSFWVAFFGRGFDSHHLHHFLPFIPSCNPDNLDLLSRPLGAALLLFSLFSRSVGGRWEKRARVMRGLGRA